MIKNISKILSFTLMIQLFSAISGLVLTRWLTVEEYAIYTIMMMIFGAMVILTKGGVDLGLNSLLGITWPDRYRARQILNVALIVRKKIALFTLPILLIFSSWLLFQNGASKVIILLMIIALCLTFIFDYHTRLYDQIIFFAGKPHKIQRMDALLALIRLLVLGIFKFVGLVNLVSAVFLGVIIAGVRIVPMKNLLKKELPVNDESTLKSDIKEIKTITRRQYPLEVFYIFQGQTVLVLIAILGGEVTNTASFGALNRIGQLFLPLTTILTSLAIPRFCQKKQKEVMTSLILWSLLPLIAGLIFMSIAFFYPDILLLLVGEEYSSLGTELLIVVIFFSAKAFSHFVWSLLANRGLNKLSFLQVPIFIIWCVLSPSFLNFNLFSDVLWFQLGFPISLFLASICEFLYSAYNEKTD